jgi:hypothetical protein
MLPDHLPAGVQVQYSKSGVKGDLTTAHPALLANGDLINLVSAVGVGFNVYRHQAGAFEQRQLIATVPHRRPLAPAWVHDFPATQVGCGAGWFCFDLIRTLPYCL